MSSKYEAVVAALANDPELAARVKGTSSIEERAQILTEAGLELPTQAEVDAELLSGVAGGTSQTSEGVTDCAVSGTAFIANPT